MKFAINGVEREFSLELGNDRLNLMVEDEGITWFVVGITSNGKLVRFEDIPREIGFELTNAGRVKVDKTLT